MGAPGLKMIGGKKAAVAKHAVTGKVVSTKSKTGNPECSQAMSLWVLGRKSGSVPSSVYATLGKCRAQAHALHAAHHQRIAGNEGAAQVLEHRAKTGKVGAKNRTEMARALVAKRKAVGHVKGAKPPTKPAATPKPPAKTVPTKPVPPIRQVHAAIYDLGGGKANNRVLIADLRDKLKHIPSKDIDASLIGLQQKGRATAMKKDNTIDITARDRAAALKLPSGHERHLVYADAPPDRVALARALKEKRKAPERTAKIQEKAQKLRAAAPKNGMLAKGPVAEKGSARKTVEHSNTADYPDRPAYSAEANDLLKRIPTKVTTTEKGPEFIAATSAAWEKLGGTVHPTHYKEFAKVHYTKDPMALPVAGAAPGSNEFYINEKHKFWKNPDVASQLAHANGRYSSADRDSTFHHEAQHKLHHANIGHDRFYSDEMNTWKSPAHKAVSEEVSEYAGHNPAEFVAETYSGIMGGKHYSRPVYDLFDSLGGVRP